MESTGEVFAPGQFAEFCYNELKQYVEKRAHLGDSFYKHLVINTQSRTFEDTNYVNTIGSKVVIKPVGEILELSVKKNKTLQRTMVQPQHAQDSSAMEESGDSSSDKIPEDSMEVAEPTEDLPPGEISVEEAKEEDVEMEEVKEDEEIPQDEQVQSEVQQDQEQEPDFGDDEQEYPESELSEGALMRINELINSRTYELIGLDGEEENEEEMQLNNPRPRIANMVQARFMHNMLTEDHQRIDAMLARERIALAEFHQRSREHEQRIEAARAAENLPPGETSVVPGSSGDLPPGEIPDVPIEQETKEEQEVTQEKDEEVKIYQEELQCRKDIDIFAQTPTAKFMELLKPESEEQAGNSFPENFEDLFVKEGIVKTNRPFQNKIPMQLDRPLEPEPRVKVEVPKPEPKGKDQGAEEYECALDGLKVLDKHYKLKTFGFYGKHCRGTHGNALNFVKFRKANPIAHPCAKFDIDEHALVALYCELFYSTPTPEDFFYQKAITYTCEDHRLRLKEDEKML